MKLEQLLEKIPYFSNDFYGDTITTSHNVAEFVYNVRQSEIDKLKSRIFELESDNEELRHILRSNP